MTDRRHREGMRTARLLMVLSTISPLFVIWAFRGNNLVPDRYFLSLCGLMVVLPNGFLWLRIRTAKKLGEKREIVIGSAEDHREHLLVYLFTMLLPLYAANFGTWRNLSATLAALAFIVFLFWRLDLHYINVVFAAWNFRVFTVYPPSDDNPLTGKGNVVLITHRVTLSPGEHLTVYRLSDTVFLETG